MMIYNRNNKAIETILKTSHPDIIPLSHSLAYCFISIREELLYDVVNINRFYNK